MNDLEKMLKEIKFIHDITEDMVDYVRGANDGPDHIADKVSRDLLYLTDSIRIIKDSTKKIMEGDEHEQEDERSIERRLCEPEQERKKDIPGGA